MMGQNVFVVYVKNFEVNCSRTSIGANLKPDYLSKFMLSEFVVRRHYCGS